VDSPDLAHTATLAGAPAAPSGELPEGLRLGHFRIERKLGAGGMGEVYLATDLALDRPVAIKVLPSSSSSGSARERLIREARAQARVQHANIAHIYFIGEDSGRLYFAMEYIAGVTLAERVAGGPLAVDDALAMIRAAALGLREAQRSGFTHRDVKPSNLMVDAHGAVKVLDFGLVAGSPEKAADGPVAQTTLAGTPLYMAPEQARGDAVDFRADVYALGATLYHLVSGRPPFVAESVDELVTLHRSAPRPSVPRGKSPRTRVAAVDALVTRMMAPDPARRFASYDELLAAIDAVSIEHTKPAGFLVRTIATGVDLTLASFAVVLVRVAVVAVWRPAGDLRLNMGAYVFYLGALFATFAIGRWGTTPGKALFELEVVAFANGQRPSWRQAVVRELVLFSAMFVVETIEVIQRATDASWLVLPGGDLVGVLVTFAGGALLLHAALGVPGKRAPWDRVAGTMVRYRTTRRTS
jgi:serine/threonine-protein kinase